MVSQVAQSEGNIYLEEASVRLLCRLLNATFEIVGDDIGGKLYGVAPTVRVQQAPE